MQKTKKNDKAHRYRDLLRVRYRGETHSEIPGDAGGKRRRRRPGKRELTQLKLRAREGGADGDGANLLCRHGAALLR